MSKVIGMGKLSAKGGFNLFLGQSLSHVISALGTLVVVRLLNPAQYGLFSIALTFPAITSLFVGWGMGSAMVKYIAQYKSEDRTAEIRRVLAYGIFFKTATGILLSIISFFLATFVATNIFHKPEVESLIRIASITVFAESLLTAAFAVFTGFERMKYYSLTMIFRTASWSLLAPLLVFLGYGTMGAVVGYAMAFLFAGMLGIIIIYIIFNRKLRIVNGEKSDTGATFKTMFRYGLPLSVKRILGGFQGAFYNFFVAIYCTSFMIGNYSAALKFVVLITFFTIPINTVLFPAFSKLNPEKEMKTLKIIFQSSVKYAALLTVPVTAAIMVLSKPLVFTLFGEEYSSTPLFLSLYAISYLYTALGSLSVTNFINGLGKTEVTMKLHLINLAIGLPLSVILIPRFGIIGLIFTSLVTGIPSLAIALWWIKKRFHVTVNWISSAKILFASATAAIPTYIILSQLDFHGWIGLLVGGTVFLAIYLVTTPLIGAVDRSDINNLRQMLTDLGPFTRILSLLLGIIEKFIPRSPKASRARVLFIVGDEITFSKAPSSRILYIARTLKNKGFTVEVLGGKGEDVKDLKNAQKGGMKHVARLRIRFSAYRKAVSNSYKNVIIRGTLLAFPLLPLRALNKRIILDFHGWLFKEIYWYKEKTIYTKLKVLLYYFLEKAAIKYSNFIICPSKGAQNLLGEREKARSILLENGLDIKEAKKVMHEAELKKTEIYKKYSIPKNKHLIGFLGNWAGDLDMEVMFEAAKIAGVSMIVIGEGPKLDEFKKKWRIILFTGKLPRHEALEIIYLCNATLVPYKDVDRSYSFYSKRKVKDYLSLGKPIIMADVKARERFLIPNKNVLLYKPGNAEDLADKIKRLISDKDLQQKMKQNNLMLAPQFDWTALVEKSGLLKTISPSNFTSSSS